MDRWQSDQVTRPRMALVLPILWSVLATAAVSAQTPSAPGTVTAGPSSATGSGGAGPFQPIEFPVAAGTHPHDVAPAPDGSVWFTGQASGVLGRLDPSSGQLTEIPLGAGAAPHGVIVGPDGAPWITDGGQDAIVRVDPATHEVTLFSLPPDRRGANLNTATFDGAGTLWFTGQSGIYGRLDAQSGSVEVFDAPRGRGPYGIATTPSGEVWYASLAGSYIGHIDRRTGAVTVVEPPTAGQGARRIWSDSSGRLWVAEWNAGQVGRYDAASGEWKEWRLPGAAPAAYAVFVDDQDIVWLTDFGANAILRFDPTTETFKAVPMPDPDAAVRQLLGRPGEVWGAESGLDRLVLIRTS
jgi:virginiamycin B lyase